MRRHVDVHRSQRGEDVGLQESDEHFEHRQEDEHGEGQHTKRNQDAIARLKEGL